MRGAWVVVLKRQAWLAVAPPAGKNSAAFVLESAFVWENLDLGFAAPCQMTDAKNPLTSDCFAVGVVAVIVVVAGVGAVLLKIHC